MDTTNEPVAWMLLRDESCVELTEWFGVMRGWEEFLGDNEKIVELYTHPVKEQDTDCQYCKQGCIRCDARKQLTDEEIDELSKEVWERPWLEVHRKFARAILRKAQEK